MAFSLENEKYSITGKRFDMRVKVAPFTSDDYHFRLRILSRVIIEEKRIRSFVQQIIDRKKEWCSKGQKPNDISTTLPLNDVNANAFINPKS